VYSGQKEVSTYGDKYPASETSCDRGFWGKDRRNSGRLAECGKGGKLRPQLNEVALQPGQADGGEIGEPPPTGGRSKKSWPENAVLLKQLYMFNQTNC